MSGPTPTIKLLRSPWNQIFYELLSCAVEDLLLASPFIKKPKVDEIIQQLHARRVLGQIRLALITDLRPESALAGSMDLEALATLGNRIESFELTHLPSLHAKVYVADLRMAVVTSGNLTQSGMVENLEYGVAFREEAVVQRIRADIESYARLGAIVTLEDVAALAQDIRELKQAFRRAQGSIRARARRLFREKLEETQVHLLRHRARGRTTHGILADTILFLLGKGPLRTVELHPLVKSIHPDICDDSVDRVIDGVSFGKKWKHHVRNAQQFLKREGRIRFDGSRWHLIQE